MGSLTAAWPPDKSFSFRGARSAIACRVTARTCCEIEAALPRIHCPVSILWGEADEWISVGQGRKLQVMIPGSRLRTVPHSGHLMQEDVPEAIITALGELRR